MKIRALIVDDEPLARRAVRRCLELHTDVDVVAECGDGQSAVDALSRLTIDLVFLDVQMPELDGFNVVSRLGINRLPTIIFVTAFDQYAVRAFDANAIDYLLKPFGQSRFDRALARARERLSLRGDAGLLQKFLESMERENAYLERIPISENGRVLFVATNDVQWLESAGNYVRLHTATAQYEIRGTLKSMETKLDRKRFGRIHRSIIVNLDYVKELHPWFHGYHLVVLQSGRKLRMSRYQKEIAVRLGIAST